MPRNIRNLLLALVAVFVLVMLTVLFWAVGRTPPPSPLPNPNGYDDFLKATALLPGGWGDTSTLDHDGLRAWVSTNSESLRLLRVGLAAELALRCYQSERGRVPMGLEQLVPHFLQRVPADPFSGRPLIYDPTGTHWLLYSVGEVGVDDGGKPVGRSVSGTVTRGDLFNDSPF
jgi:hypothetical protein